MNLGQRKPRPALREIHLAALKWAIKVMRTPVTHGDRANGLAAFGAWRDALSKDGDFANADLDALRPKYMLHMDATDVIAEGRWYAHNYLKAAALDLPEARTPLRRAAERCRDEHDLIWEMWKVGGGWRKNRSDGAVRRFAEPETRKKFAAIIEKLHDADKVVAESIEEAVEILTADEQ